MSYHSKDEFRSTAGWLLSLTPVPKATSHKALRGARMNERQAPGVPKRCGLGLWDAWGTLTGSTGVL